MTSDEIADLLRVDVQTVRRWCRDGRLVATKLGRVWRVKKSDLKRLLEEGNDEER